MKPLFLALGFALATVSVMGPQAIAHEYRAKDIQIDHPWARPTITTRQPAAVFFTLKNQGGAADRLIGAKVDARFAGGAELHTTLNDDGVMRMRRLADGLDVPAGATVEVQPGGAHLMLFNLAEPLEDGFRFPVTLVFENAGEVEVVVAVETPVEAAPAMDHSAHGS